MTTDRTFSIVLDLRCLQDPGYVTRGIGRHALNLLRTAPRRVGLIGLVDETLPPLLPEARAAIDRVYGNAYAARRDSRACVMLSPMTHDPIFAARLWSDPTLLRAAVAYDFIPHHWPDRYLPSPADRLAYAMAMRWLARCDLFLPISRSTAEELATLLSIPDTAIAVSGCAVDPIFQASAAGEIPRHILVVGGGDPRKNPEVVIRAHASASTLQQGKGIPLVVAGSYGAAEAASFRAIAAASGGRQDLVEVPGHVSDTQLVDLYRCAFAVVSPSRSEGFSIPIVEGMAAGVPCLVSNIPPHAELVRDPDCRFDPDDDAALGPKLARAASDADWRTAALVRQAGVWPAFRADAVGERFWNAILQRLDAQLPFPGPSVLRGHRPRVALLSPVPPDRSGVADYTAATCAELGKLVDLHVFTETAQPAKLRHVASVRPLDVLPHVSVRFDRVISVIGNSHFHLRIFDMLRRYGSACIAHDARMLGFYRILLGQERALDVASRELGRPVTEAKLNVWLSDESKLEALFLGEIAESAAPTIVHSQVTARMFSDRYGVTPAYLPFSIYRPWTAEELTPARRAAARARLGIPAGEVAIATFGFVDPSKAPEECIWALDVLRGWGVPASLHFVGGINAHQHMSNLRVLTASLGHAAHVRFAQDYVTEQIYADYLVGADLGIQLRTYGFGSVSGALLDCAAAGLPTVANISLADAIDVPDYVRRIPDGLSPLLLAEALADLRDAGFAAMRPEPARRAFAEERSFISYARRLCQALVLAA